VLVRTLRSTSFVLVTSSYVANGLTLLNRVRFKVVDCSLTLQVFERILSSCLTNDIQIPTLGIVCSFSDKSTPERSGLG
jgi:hypothetical protein